MKMVRKNSVGFPSEGSIYFSSNMKNGTMKEEEFVNGKIID
jgi:hypothetical protein